MDMMPPEHPIIKTESPDLSKRTGWQEAARWLVAAAIVIAAHGAGAYGLYNMAAAEVISDGDKIQAMVVEFAPELIAPPPAEQVADIAQAETTPEPEPEPQFEPPQPEPVKEELPEPVAQPVEETVPDLVEAEKPEVALPKPVEEPEPKSKPDPEPEPQPKPKSAPEKKKPVKVEKKPVKQANKAAPRDAIKGPESRHSAAPVIDGAPGARAAAPSRGLFNADPGISSDKYQSKLQRYLTRQTRALKRRVKSKGSLSVAIVIDPGGNILSTRIASPSGDPAVDQMALDLIRKSSPVPAQPVAIAKARMAITVPFDLR